MNEIDDVYELISASNKVLGQKIASLRKSLIDEHNLENDGSSQSGKQTYWGLTTFVDEMSKLMESWTVDDLSEFSTVWNGCTEQGLSVLQQKFDAMFFVPSLYIDEVDGGDINTRSKAALLSLCNAVEMDTATGFESRSLRDAFFNFCSKSTEDEEVSFEDEFMAFSKSLVGEFGLERVEAIFAQLKPQELVTHTEDELDLISMLDAIEKNPSVEISIRKFNASIDNVLSRGDLDHDMKRILHLLKVHAPARIILSKKMSRTALIAHVHNISKGIELPVFHALINIFVQRNSNSTGDDKPASANEKAVIVEEEEEEEEEKEKRDHVEDIV